MFCRFLRHAGQLTNLLLGQDGRIDYGEFEAMMQKGSKVGLERRTMRNSVNMSV